MESPVDDLIHQAVEAGKAGDKETAKKLLSRVVRQDPTNARGWYLLSQVVDTKEQAIYCLEKALELDPDNIRVAQRLQQLDYDTSETPSGETSQPIPTVKEQPKDQQKTNWVVIGAVSIVVFCVLCVGASIVASNLGLLETPTPVAEQPNETEVKLVTLEPTVLPLPTDTENAQPPPTQLPTETNTLVPTLPPSTNTPVPIPEVVIPYSGVGDAIVDLDIAAIGGFGVLQIQGNQESRHFSVKGYDESGGATELYVNTTEPYFGRRALNLREYENTVRLEISATGPWEIQLISLSENLNTILNVPGSYNGKGDDVLFLRGSIPDTARVTGNADARHFALVSFSRGLFARDLLINTTEPYSGEVLMDNDTYALEFTATGDWTIEIISK